MNFCCRYKIIFKNKLKKKNNSLFLVIKNSKIILILKNSSSIFNLYIISVHNQKYLQSNQFYDVQNCLFG